MGKRLRQWIALILVGGWLWLGIAQPATALTEEQRLLNEVWRLVNRTYLDGSFNHQDWSQVRQTFFRRPLNTREETYSTIQAMLATLDEPFTRLLKPDQYRSLQTSTSGELTGVGLQIALDGDTKALVVIAPIENSPADRAGILPADRILEIDGIPTLNLTLDEAAARMRGQVGSEVALTIQRQDQTKTITLRRDRIELNPVIAELHQIPSQGVDTGDTTATKATNTNTAATTQATSQAIGYLRLSQFNANATTEVAKAIKRLEGQGAASYILDLRNNPGGLLQAGIEIARLWIDHGTIVYTANRQGLQDQFDAVGSALTDAPLVVLVNQGTASASEILAGALQDNGRAQLVGEQTFGKGLIQSLFQLSDGSGLAVTVAKYETPNHHDIHKQGITPDHQVPLEPLTRSQLGTNADSQYRAAVALLTKQAVLAGAT